MTSSPPGPEPRGLASAGCGPYSAGHAHQRATIRFIKVPPPFRDQRASRLPLTITLRRAGLRELRHAGTPSSAASVFAARSAEAHHRSSGFILKRTPRGISNDDPVSRDPGWKISRGLGLGGGGALAGMCATTVQSRAKGGRAWSRLFYALRGRSLFSITRRMWRRCNSLKIFEQRHIAGRFA